MSSQSEPVNDSPRPNELSRAREITSSVLPAERRDRIRPAMWNRASDPPRRERGEERGKGDDRESIINYEFIIISHEYTSSRRTGAIHSHAVRSWEWHDTPPHTHTDDHVRPSTESRCAGEADVPVGSLIYHCIRFRTCSGPFIAALARMYHLRKWLVGRATVGVATCVSSGVLRPEQRITKWRPSVTREWSSNHRRKVSFQQSLPRHFRRSWLFPPSAHRKPHSASNVNVTGFKYFVSLRAIRSIASASYARRVHSKSTLHSRLFAITAADGEPCERFLIKTDKFFIENCALVRPDKLTSALIHEKACYLSLLWIAVNDSSEMLPASSLDRCNIFVRSQWCAAWSSVMSETWEGVFVPTVISRLKNARKEQNINKKLPISRMPINVYDQLINR